jgi:serine protease AprX
LSQAETLQHAGSPPVPHPFSFVNRRAPVGIALLLAIATVPKPASETRLDAALQARARAPRGESRVIVRTTGAAPFDDTIERLGGKTLRPIGTAGHVAVLPDAALAELSRESGIVSVSLDRPISGATDSGAGSIVEAGWLRENLGVDGSGVGVATIDSGVSPSHDDLGGGRVVHWADFVAHQPVAYDDYGHGTHVAGIIVGAGVDSAGGRRGIAPGADLVVLKALDGTGNGHISDVIAAVDYAIANRERFNIRVLNLSVAAGVYESYLTDPLAQAALRAVRAGIVVVAAAGNFGLNAYGESQYGSIAAPGNAPWVLTVGAADDKGTADRTDDVVAAFSSRGPTAIDRTPKPDLVAPGVGIESAADPSSTLYSVQPGARVWGVASTVSQPYLRLSGTSMAAPVVTGTVALMLQADPQLTPNAVKAILQFTAEPRVNTDLATQGAGLLNARGAVAVARQLTTRPESATALEEMAGGTGRWGRLIIWGPQRVVGDAIRASMAAWDLDVTWGANTTPSGEPIDWSALCAPERSRCGASR